MSLLDNTLLLNNEKIQNIGVKVRRAISILYGISLLLSLMTGLIPQLFSLQRVFYVDDTLFYLIFFVATLILYLGSLISLLIVLANSHIFVHWKAVALICSIPLITSILLVADSLIFMDFYLTESGFNVSFNILVYIIDLLIIFPLFVFANYIVQKYVMRHIRVRQ